MNWQARVNGVRLYTRGIVDPSQFFDGIHRLGHSFLVLLLEDGSAYKLEYATDRHGKKVDGQHLPGMSCFFFFFFHSLLNSNVFVDDRRTTTTLAPLYGDQRASKSW